MEINISKCDAIHILNWLNCFKRICDDPKNGIQHLANDVEQTRERLWEECKKYFPEPKADPNNPKKKAPFGIMEKNNMQISYNIGMDLWWMDKKYLRK